MLPWTLNLVVASVRRPFDLPGESQHEAGDDSNAAQELPPVELLSEPERGDDHAEDGLGEDREGSHVDRAFPDNEEPDAVADGGADDCQPKQQAPGLQRKRFCGSQRRRPVNQQVRRRTGLQGYGQHLHRARPHHD